MNSIYAATGIFLVIVLIASAGMAIAPDGACDAALRMTWTLRHWLAKRLLAAAIKVEPDDQDDNSIQDRLKAHILATADAMRKTSIDKVTIETEGVPIQKEEKQLTIDDVPRCYHKIAHPSGRVSRCLLTDWPHEVPCCYGKYCQETECRGLYICEREITHTGPCLFAKIDPRCIEVNYVWCGDGEQRHARCTRVAGHKGTHWYDRSINSEVQETNQDGTQSRDVWQGYVPSDINVSAQQRERREAGEAHSEPGKA